MHSWSEKTIESQIQQEIKELKNAEQECNALRFEVGKALLNQSRFSADTLAQALQETQEKIQAIKESLSSLQAELLISKERSVSIEQRLNRLTWSDLFDFCDKEVKKMIICHLIHRIFVFRDYALCLEVNFPISSDDINT